VDDRALHPCRVSPHSGGQTLLETQAAVGLTAIGTSSATGGGSSATGGGSSADVVPATGGSPATGGASATGGNTATGGATGNGVIAAVDILYMIDNSSSMADKQQVLAASLKGPLPRDPVPARRGPQIIHRVNTRTPAAQVTDEARTFTRS
jgi:hypothetical protein